MAVIFEMSKLCSGSGQSRFSLLLSIANKKREKKITWKHKNLTKKKLNSDNFLILFSGKKSFRLI